LAKHRRFFVGKVLLAAGFAVSEGEVLDLKRIKESS
jgi:hypothetical protein